MKKTDIRLPEELFDKIKDQANSIGVKKSEYIRAILIWWFSYVE